MALWLAFACGLAGMTICWFGHEIMLLAGQEPAIAEMAGRFLRVIMWAMIPMIAANALRSVVSALGRPVYATAITALAVGVSALANYAFVFGNLGAPAMGLEGSALASVVTGVFGFLSYIAAIQADRRLRRYRLFGNWWRSEWQRFRELVRTGVPVALAILAEAALFSGAAFLMGNIGASQLAGQEPAIAEMAGRFLRTIMWAMVPMIFANVLRSVVSALGRPLFATAITALAIGVAALANYAFVFGNLGAPALGL